MDGISIDEKFYLFALRMDNGDNGNLAFSIDGVALIMFDINSDNQIINHENIFKFEGFRSICPVTSQPDWATIYIYSKTNSLDRKFLNKYLLSFREQGDFHESCIIQIFNTALESLKSSSLNKKTHLEVVGKFLRRGGIDINPIRSTHKQMFLGRFREIQQ